MADNIENLVIEHMRHIRAQYDNILVAIQELNREMHAFCHHHRGNELDIEANRNLTANLQSRVERLERRLGLSEELSTVPGLSEDPPQPYQPRPPKRG